MDASIVSEAGNDFGKRWQLAGGMKHLPASIGGFHGGF
jgi:hypothetical protein